MHASELEPYFTSKRGETTLLNFPLQYILSNLINDYSENFEQFNKTPVHYEDVVKDINFNFLNVKKRVVTEKDLIRICFPKRDPKDESNLLEGKINKKKIGAIYRYFDRENKKLYGRGGKY